MCITLSNINCLRINNYIIAFKRFYYSRNSGLLPFFRNDVKYKFRKKGLGFIVEADLREQNIRFSSDAFDILTNDIEDIELYSSMKDLGLHSNLYPSKFYASPIVNGEPNDILLITLIDFCDVQMLSGDTLVSKKIYLPSVEECKEILNILLDNRTFEKLKNWGRIINLESLREALAEEYFLALEKIHNKLNEVVLKQQEAKKEFNNVFNIA